MSLSIDVKSPLTHKGIGPGLILIIPSSPTPATPASGFLLDPVPSQKWAEEGFAVASITCRVAEGGVSDSKAVEDMRDAFRLGLKELAGCKGCDNAQKLGLIVYDSWLSKIALSVIAGEPMIACIAAYTDNAGSVYSLKRPTLLHIVSDTPLASPTGLSSYIYPSVQPYFVIPGQPTYDKASATLAHQRTLVFLRQTLGGPYFDIEQIWEEHTLYEFGERAVEKTMETMVAEPYVNHVPTLTGGIGRTALTQFYANHFIFSNPDSIALKLISRAIGPDRVVDEMIAEFIHDREIDWMMPGIPPTGKFVSVPLVAVVNVRGDKLYHEHIYWDQASVLAQIGLLPPSLAFPPGSGSGLDGKSFPLPVVGRPQADKMLDPIGVRSNELIDAAAAKQ